MLRWDTAINKVKLVVVESTGRKTRAIVQLSLENMRINVHSKRITCMHEKYLLIESNNVGHIVFSEILEIMFRCMNGIAIIVSRFIVRACKCQELSGNNPVQISIFNTLRAIQITPKTNHLEVLVLFQIKGSKVKKSMNQTLWN